MIRDQRTEAESVLATITSDLDGVKQPDENFFQAAVLNTRFCADHAR